MMPKKHALPTIGAIATVAAVILWFAGEHDFAIGTVLGALYALWRS